MIATILAPICIGRAIDAIGNDDSVIKMYLVRASLLALLVAVSQFAMNLINNSITFGTVRNIRNEAVKKIEYLPLRCIDTKAQGDIVSRVVADADQFADGLLLGFTQAFTGVMTIMVTLILMLRMIVIITLVVVIVTPLSIFIASFI